MPCCIAFEATVDWSRLFLAEEDEEDTVADESPPSRTRSRAQDDTRHRVLSFMA